MIPMKLKLKNFMSYRDPPALSFESIHTACISGNNGNGKSALIDALTWALWGQSRANSDDELIHTGQNEVEVDFEFEVNQLKYRVLRRHAKPKTAKGSGQTILELQAVSAAGARSLSGDTVTQTQQKIIQLLHMDYDTFVNSAFIRQGHADEFTRKRPADRKQVLSNILQLAVYDELEDQAREKAKTEDNRVLQIESAMSGLKEELEDKEKYQSDFEKARIDMIVTEKTTREKSQNLAALRKEREVLEAKKSQLYEINSGMATSQSNLKRWNDQALQSRAQIATCEKLITHRSLIEQNYNLLLSTRKQIGEMDQQLRTVTGLKDYQHKLEMIISKASAALQNQRAVSTRRTADLEKAIANLPQVQSQMQQITSQIAGIQESEKQLNGQKEVIKKLHADLTVLQSRRGQLKQSISEIDEKLKLLIHSAGADCPLCESHLGPDGQKKIEAKYLAEKSARASEVVIIEKETARLEADLSKQEREALQWESKIKSLGSALQSKQGVLTKTLGDIQEAQHNLEDEKVVLNKIDLQIQNREYVKEEQAALTKTINEIETIAYDAQKHEALRVQLLNLERFEAPWHKLAEAEKQAVIEKEREAQALETVAEIKQKMEVDSKRLAVLNAELTGYSGLLKRLEESEIEYQKQLSDQKEIQERLGAAKNRLERLGEVETRLKTLNEELNQHSKRSKILKDLGQALGKKGVQAMLIEMAIPEIEAEANLLLAKMTDNRMFIKIETQRENKKGEVMETLDINISDELGTRNYEMFSGGEAFRIDFAIRIALSRLLARRAGAPLPTLIIDEGFGTQDGTGMEKIKEAITTIQDDFEKILVITHINDFKDAFPVRIEVVKSTDGSSVYLN